MKMFIGISRNLIIALIVISFAAFGCNAKETAKSPQPAASSESKVEEPFSMDDLPEVVATVNKVAIPKIKLQRTYAMLLSRSRMENKKITNSEVLERSLDELINLELLKQESVSEKVAPSTGDVDKEFEKIKAQFHQPGEFEEALKKNNISMDTIRNDIETRLSINQLLEKEIGDKSIVSKDDVKAFYTENPNLFKTPESVKASHILVKVSKDSDEKTIAEARKKIEDVLSKAKKGEDFGALAKKYSEGPSAPKEGDLGYFSRGQMVKSFEDAAFSLKEGTVSEIVSTQFGFHIIKVIDHREEGTTPFDKVEASIGDYLAKLGKEKLIVEYVNKLRSRSNIERKI